MINQDSVITIVGLGLLGGSYASGLASAGYKHVKGIDVDEKAIAFAKDRGWIEEGGTDAETVQGSDLVIFCLYPHVFVKWIQQNQQYFKPHSFITDVTGIKREIIRDVNAVLRSDVEFIACHPMAGREYKGIQYSDSSLFAKANFLIVPTENNTEEAVQTAWQLARILKFPNVHTMTPELHDRMIGYLSQLTHVIAVSLMNANDNTDLADYTGDSFRDLTRIATINENMWPELFVLNKDNLVREIDEFTNEMQRFKKMIEDEDVEGMKQKLIQSTLRRKQFNKK